MRDSVHPVLTVLLAFCILGNACVPGVAQIRYRLDPEEGIVITNVPDPTQIRRRPGRSISAKQTRAYDDIIRQKAEKYQLDVGLVKAVIEAESGYDHRAVSPKGAQGLMQLMPGTAAKLGVTDPFDPEENIEGGTRYLREMLNSFEGSTELALAAYNAGPARVLWYGDIPPYQETQNYVRQVMKKTQKSTGAPSSDRTSWEPGAPDTLSHGKAPGGGTSASDSVSLAARPPKEKVAAQSKHARKRPTRIYLLSDGQGNIILTNVPVKPGTMN